MKIYDEVSEDKYKKIVKSRLQRDDFVVDDGVGGYNDNGMDDFEEADEYESEDERDRKHKKKGWLSCNLLLRVITIFSLQEDGQDRVQGKDAPTCSAARNAIHERVSPKENRRR